MRHNAIDYFGMLNWMHTNHEAPMSAVKRPYLFLFNIRNRFVRLQDESDVVFIKEKTKPKLSKHIRPYYPFKGQHTNKCCKHLAGDQQNNNARKGVLTDINKRVA